MFKNTLISLAAIRTLANSSKNYLDFILPFVSEASQKIQSPFECKHISKYILENFGLHIPERTIELTLKKIIKNGTIRKENHKYALVNSMPQDIDIDKKTEKAKLIINEVIEDIKLFAKERANRDFTDDQIVDAIIYFLSLFSVECLKFYHLNSVLPIEDIKKENWQVIIISAYIYEQQKKKSENLDKFMVLAYGNMLTTSLLCPDLKEATKSYANVKFFFDTSNIIEALGLDGDMAKDSTTMLFEQIRNLGGEICCFSHTVDEIKHVIYSASQFINRDDGVGGIVIESRKKGLEPADIILIADSAEEKIAKIGIEVIPSPGYIKDFLISEEIFEKYLDKTLRYKNKNAKHVDINSIRSIFAIRKNERAISIEKTRAIFVTKNTSFARSASEYAYDVEKTILTPAIDSYTLASIAWLKSPLEAPHLPAKEIIAFSYAALRPDSDFWISVIKQAEKLKDAGEISSTQLQIIRSSVEAQEHIITATLGEEQSINKETITEAINNATRTIEEKAKAESSELIRHLNEKVIKLESDIEKRKQSDIKKASDKIKWCKKQANKRTNIIYYTIIATISIAITALKQPNLNGLMNSLDITISNTIIKTIIDNANEVFVFALALTGFTLKPAKQTLYGWIYCRMVALEEEKGDIEISLIDGLPKEFSSQQNGLK